MPRRTMTATTEISIESPAVPETRPGAAKADLLELAGATPTSNLLPHEVSAPGHFAADSLAFAYVIVANTLAETLYEALAGPYGNLEAAHLKHRRGEVCAAAWASIQVALGASSLSVQQQRKFSHALRQRLLVQWDEYRGSQDIPGGWLDSRASSYLQNGDTENAVKLAVRIVENLVDALHVPMHDRIGKTRILAGLVGHRIVSDVCLFNEWASRGKLSRDSNPKK